jgi:hypothetical protein
MAGVILIIGPCAVIDQPTSLRRRGSGLHATRRTLGGAPLGLHSFFCADETE